MYKISLVFIIALFMSCELSDDFTSKINLIESVVNDVGSENNCKVTFEYVDSPNTELKLTLHSNNGNDLMPGKVLFDIFETLKHKKLLCDTYELKYDSNVVLEMNKDDFEVIKEKLVLFDKSIEQLSDKNYKGFYMSLNKEIKSIYSFEEFTENFENIIVSNYTIFDGFNLSTFEGNVYVIMRKSNGLGNHIMVSYMWDDSENIVHAIELE